MTPLPNPNHTTEASHIAPVGSDELRAHEAYTHTSLPSELKTHCRQHFLAPDDANIDDALPFIQEHLAAKKAMLVIPMRERGRVITSLLSHVTRVMSQDQIVVVDNGSDAEAVAAVREFPRVHLIKSSDWLSKISWEQLLPMLALSDQPKGKGMALLAGYLYIYASHPDCQIVIQHDSEIQEYATYRGLEYLTWAMLQRPDSLCVKIAKTNRGNERCMAARGMLQRLSTTPVLGDSIRQRAGELFTRLIPHKWMLTGEFGMTAEVAMNRPFATGYLEETLISVVCEDLSAERGYNYNTTHVANPHPRLDGENDVRKESLMQQQICNFLLTLALEATDTTQWTIDSIAALNQGPMSRILTVPWIPSTDEPVVVEALPDDRIIPSVSMLVEAGLVMF